MGCESKTPTRNDGGWGTLRCGRFGDSDFPVPDPFREIRIGYFA
jgi:hypothetical protein